MITASHNPYTDNGIKVFTTEGGKLPDETEDNLNNLINSEIQNRQTGLASSDTSLLLNYEDYLVASMNGDNLQGVKLL